MTRRILDNGIERDMTAEEEAEFEAAMPSPSAPPPRFIPKVDLYRRMEDPELELFEATLAALPARVRLRWQDGTAAEVDAAEIRSIFVEALGAERAAEILDGTPAP